MCKQALPFFMIYACLIIYASEVFSQFNCIKIQPRWVEDMKEDGIDVGRLQLHSLFIPGSHNAGAYNKFTSYTGENGFRTTSNLKPKPFRRHSVTAIQCKPGGGHLDATTLWHALPRSQGLH